jgi:hypothetical protein
MKKKKENMTNKGGNLDQPNVSRSQLILDRVYFFDNVDLQKEGITKLKKAELLELIQGLNKQMIDSTDSWDGG